MKAKDMMSADVACCSRDTTVQEAAALMQQRDCGCLPVVEGNDERLVGVVTDRDLACRCLAEGKGPDTPVSEVMTTGCSCCGPEAGAEDVQRIMAEGQVRRVPVVDDGGCCVGIVSQADLARANMAEQEVAGVLEGVSKPTEAPSAVTGSGPGRVVA